MIKREYFKDVDYKPFLFYVIFGVRGDQLQVSASKHHVDGFPEGLEMHGLNRLEHGDYIDGFFSGSMGDILRSQNADLYEKCRSASDCVVIRGDVMQDDTLDYMQNVIGIGKAFFDQGAVGILDVLTFSMFSEEKWTEKFFEQEINAQNHVTILVSEENGGYWLHTRGLIEFGRPDLSMHAKDDAGIEECRQIFNQMIFYSGQGVFFNGEVNLHTHSGNTYTVKATFVNDFDNDDYNNAYCNVEIVS